MYLKTKPFVLLFIFILSFSSFSYLRSQTLDRRLNKKEEQDFRLPIRSPFEKDNTKEETRKPFDLETQFKMQTLEATVDPDQYIVGPGDIFIVTIWTAAEALFKTPVTPEGYLIIPTIGAIHIDGKTLSEAQKMIIEAGIKKYRHSEITANLFKLRSFRVHVTGQVMNPGLYNASAIDRVSDLIKDAGGLTGWAYERAIKVKHLDGSEETVDLYRYKKLGELESNIFLKGGDVIYVPSIDLANPTIKIEGLVNDPGVYQLAENETLKDFLLRVDAFNKRADLQYAYIERKTDSNNGVEIIPIFKYLDNLGNGHSDLYLQDGDVIMIPQRHEEVYVIGAVRNPGHYAFYPKLRSRDYVGFAGGTERAVSLSKIKVIRKNSKEQLRGPDLLLEPGDTVIVPQRVEFGLREITTLVGTVTSILLTMKAIGVIN